MGIDEELRDRLMALKEGAAAPLTGLGTTFRMMLDLGDEESYLHARDASF